MSNLEASPQVTPCESAGSHGAVAEFFVAREVPLGGVRGIKVNRALPQRSLPTVGAWCFLDKFGPHNDGMLVLPHPHIGLQTVTWPLAGEVRHRDSIGNDVVLRPGQLNLMTSGRGVSHSEVSAPGTVLSGLQLWVALPAEATGMAPDFEHHPKLPVFRSPGVEATVFMGTLGDATSPATTHTPLVGAQLSVAGGTIPLRPDFEYALLLLDGSVQVADVELTPGPLLYLGTGRESLTFAGTAEAILLGGEPFADDLVMWWNFVGRSHDEIAAARADWEGADPQRFGVVAGHGPDRIPAPGLPNLRLKPRPRRPS
ncbi:redox-sensitive bicupin YhaK (pirin superfamily) [Kibdelosporangium banguiense]|uniref:Redox-sensitive bicupin YhaK (Pirin superfamily) n=1 Tax=Kibdelosporangium banguiense TaxID=1365924 RepID=A0ABS4TZH2_9PSEU|nr:pirin family protein [Kibdelosporangium banguiense]MBP2329793.1 redox-sensitive bicupin YhaK (pirin superfamily) [Kibdelosporangium banguiense]